VRDHHLRAEELHDPASIDPEQFANSTQPPLDLTVNLLPGQIDDRR